jgi:hypothetical protein
MVIFQEHALTRGGTKGTIVQINIIQLRNVLLECCKGGGTGLKGMNCAVGEDGVKLANSLTDISTNVKDKWLIMMQKIPEVSQ